MSRQKAGCIIAIPGVGVELIVRRYSPEGTLAVIASFGNNA